MPSTFSRIPGALTGAALPALLLIAGCSQPAPQAPPPPVVDVVMVTAGSVPNIVELPGRIEAVRSAEVRARTDGIISRRLYQEGTDVREGTPLFQIDPRDKQAQVQQAQAALQRAQAARENAAAILQRYQPLVSDRAVSALEYDNARSALRQADAGVADARATLARAQLELGYTLVRAPISGRVGRAQVTEGALASAASATLLTTIEQMEPVYAVFTQSSSELQHLLAEARSGKVDLPALPRVEVRLILEDGSEYGPVGHIDFADQSVNPSTGSQTLRATFVNPRRALLPGQFVRGRVTAGTVGNGIAVPQRAVQISNEEARVAVVGGDGVVQFRAVTLGGQTGGRWVIRTGLKAGERVIVDGWQKVQAGQKVQARPAAPATK
ncbi:MAG TPA: efflux RND transporter periplasmic adaptor subunit [Sphingomonas sp.]|nr:efflux RND transporter periplasmic adaptor subunit [Sphingomonas sp.]